jgi:predicted permease
MRRDLAYSFRTLRRSPLFTTAAVLSLALGIGANTAIFSLLNQVVLRSLPVADPEHLVLLHTDYSAPGSSSSDNAESVFSYPMYRDLRDRDAAFSGLVARMGAPAGLSWHGSTESARGELVSGNFFQALGIPPAIGRVLTPEDDGAPGANPVAVLSHSYWTSRFAGDRSILNQTVIVNGHPMVVIGVAAAGFNGMVQGAEAELYVPIAMQRAMIPTMDALQDRRIRWLNLFARLKPGIDIRRAQSATDAVFRSILEMEITQVGRMRTPRDRDEFLNARAQLRPAAQGVSQLREQFEKPLLALMTLVGLVLLIACANIASLLLARATGRQREIAIRLAIGASRGSLVRQLLCDGLLLAVAGGLLGLAVAWWGSSVLVNVLPKDSSKWLTSTIDLRLLLFNLGASVICGLLFGLIPALQATRPAIAGTLKDQTGNIASAGGPARLRQALVVGQLALSLLLVAGAGLFTSSLMNLLNLNLGFRTQRLMTFGLNASISRPKIAESATFYRDAADRLSSVPGVSAVTFGTSGGPFAGGSRGGNLTVQGYAAKPDEYTGASQINANPGYFQAMGIPLRAGREFTARDDAGAPKVIVVNEAFVKRYLAGQNPIGARMMFGSSDHPVFDREIVGVAADSRVDLRKPAKETVYLPYSQNDRSERAVFYVRYAGDEGQVAAAIRHVLRETDPNLPVATIKTVDLRIRETLYIERLIAVLSAGFGVLATLLAAIGLYGVIAYAVTRRTSEIGIRMALGALPRDVLRMILREAGVMAGVGIGIGLVAAIVLSRLVESQLFGIRPADPGVLAAAAGTLVLVALLAALIPSWKASRINPVTALKYE